MTKLEKIHLPYGSLSTWETEQARSHTNMHGHGTIPEMKTKHRVRFDMGKVYHFVEFISRPYFYLDVSYGIKELTLDNGDRIETPNVVRILTGSIQWFSNTWIISKGKRVWDAPSASSKKKLVRFKLGKGLESVTSNCMGRVVRQFEKEVSFKLGAGVEYVTSNCMERAVRQFEREVSF